jgi:hypothetical protein
MPSDYLLPGRYAPSDVDDQSRDQTLKIEASVESVGEGGQIVGGGFAIVQRLMGACQRNLQVAQHHGDPQELRQVAGLTVADDHGLVSPALKTIKSK